MVVDAKLVVVCKKEEKMNELIQVVERHIGDGAIQTVNARDLHAFLGVGKVLA